MHVRRTLPFVALLAGLLAGPALAAAPPATGLGESLPNTTNVHAFVAPQPDGTARLMIVECKVDPINCNKGSP
ncbi:MAG TPA: hypothetical protein VGN46_14170 [Luteibacter sp.]|jgi:hypothetical protein|uniref:hypothetical protein n=1 Tax=Luteibacter sp. TaxID=1886636 RepID=UPI002F42F4DB